MAFKGALIAMVPDADPKKHRSVVKTSKAEVTVVLVELMNFDQAVNVAKDLVQNEGIQSLSLCPGFTHEAVAKIANAVGEGVPINVTRGDVPSTRLLGEILVKEGWFPEGH